MAAVRDWARTVTGKEDFSTQRRRPSPGQAAGLWRKTDSPISCLGRLSHDRAGPQHSPLAGTTIRADFLPVQNGPAIVGLVGAAGVSAVCLRLGGIVTFSAAPCPD